MRTRVYIDDNLIFDSQDQDSGTVLKLDVTTTINEAGYAEFTLPYNHPEVVYNMNSFVPFRSIIRIYREAGVEDDSLLFRGRLLNIKENFYGSKTFVCEGELSFLNDTVVRPQTISGSLYQIFAKILTLHNGQVDQPRQFLAGTVNVTTEESTPNMTFTDALSAASALAQLLKTYGGFLKVKTNEYGYRTIEWHTSSFGISSQDIQFGVNLCDYSSEFAVQDFANRIVPYGKNVNGTRLTISTGGYDYVENVTSQSIYGVITKAVVFDEIDSVEKLEQYARAYLSQSSSILKSISIAAVDMSALLSTPQAPVDATGSWFVGQLIHVVVPQRGIDAYYMLSQRKYDLLNPANDVITLGSNPVTLTGTISK